MNRLILEDNPGRIARFKQMYPDAIITEDAQEAIRHLSTGSINWVSLDHDLNHEIFVDSSRSDCGAEVARYIADNKIDLDYVEIHTANEGAAHLMRKILSDYNPVVKPFEGVYDSRSRSHWKKYSDH